MQEAREAQEYQATWHPKIPPVRVPSDDCALYVGRRVEDGQIVVQGEAHYMHVGEWVDVLPVRSMREYILMSRLASEAGGPGGAALGRMAEAFDGLCNTLAERLVAWSWTDMMGEPLPQPYRNPAVIAGLSDDELVWLLTAAQGETGTARKNGTTP